MMESIDWIEIHYEVRFSRSLVSKINRIVLTAEGALTRLAPVVQCESHSSSASCAHPDLIIKPAVTPTPPVLFPINHHPYNIQHKINR